MSVSPSDTKHKSADASPPRKALNHRHSQGAHVPSVMVWQDFSDHHAKFMSTPILKQYRHIVTNIWDSKEVNSLNLQTFHQKGPLHECPDGCQRGCTWIGPGQMPAEIPLKPSKQATPQILESQAHMCIQLCHHGHDLAICELVMLS